MKTLTQVEPRTDVATLSGDPSKLSGNITGVANKKGIAIQANNVTLDLRGFALSGPNGSSNAGIRVPALDALLGDV
jgi:hypothetical protein